MICLSPPDDAASAAAPAPPDLEGEEVDADGASISMVVFASKMMDLSQLYCNEILAGLGFLSTDRNSIQIRS